MSTKKMHLNQLRKKIAPIMTKPLINARVSKEVYDWVVGSAAASKRSVSEYLFLLLDQAMQMEKASKCRRRKC
jgi:hypothetical protein